jgi:hypothetical protein
MRLSNVVLAALVTLVASTEAVAASGTSVQAKTFIEPHGAVDPVPDDRRFLRIHGVDPATEERALLGAGAVEKMKQKLFKLKMKLAMPRIKKAVTNFLTDVLTAVRKGFLR